jgi:hypothetical protein
VQATQRPAIRKFVPVIQLLPMKKTKAHPKPPKPHPNTEKRPSKKLENLSTV